MQTITPTIYRRFILGRQGLWPGRRWSGREDTAVALREIEALQIDPVTVVAESHDIALWGRLLDYQPAHLRHVAYAERQFFDYGGVLYFYPISELPYWRVIMDHHRANSRWSEFMTANPDLLDYVRAQLRERGPLRNRDLDGKMVTAYRSGKDTGLALYAMWITGELMTHGRHGKERIYDLTENIAPAALQNTASPAAAETYFVRKALAQHGLLSARALRPTLREVRHEIVPLAEAQAILDALVERGEALPVSIAGHKDLHYHLSGDAPLLEDLRDGRFPTAWQPLGPDTTQEVTFLSPLEFVSARGRARPLFDFDYIWEIYKPAAQRVYGPYTLPILYGDRLVGRADMRHDRPSSTLVINGLWLEEWFAADKPFTAALRRGLARFQDFLGALQSDLSAVHLPFLS